MATIELYAGRINLMSEKFNSMRSSVNDFKTASQSLQKHLNLFDGGICNTEVIKSNIQTSINTQQTELDSMDNLIDQIEEFFDMVVSTDEAAAEVINQSKDEFYEEYTYLKPDCEKSGWEKFKDGCKKVGEWCKEHWKLLVTIVLVIAAVIVIIATAGAAAGPMTALLLMAAKGVLVGAAIGGIVGGTMSKLFGGSFFEGFENGAFGGAISGLLSCGLGSWIGGGVGAELSVGQTVLVGALSESGTSLIGDIGDILIKGDSISFAHIIFNAGVSACLGIVGSYSSFRLGKRFNIKINGIPKGRDSWSYVFHYNFARSMRNGTDFGLKPILKGYGSKIIEETWENLIEIPKGFFGETVSYLNEKEVFD